MFGFLGKVYNQMLEDLKVFVARVQMALAIGVGLIILAIIFIILT
jgi:hypothetical protein